MRVILIAVICRKKMTGIPNKGAIIPSVYVRHMSSSHTKCVWFEEVVGRKPSCTGSEWWYQLSCILFLLLLNGELVMIKVPYHPLSSFGHSIHVWNENRSISKSTKINLLCIASTNLLKFCRWVSLKDFERLQIRGAKRQQNVAWKDKK